MRTLWILVALFFVASLASTASADRSDAIEGETILEADSYDAVNLLIEVGTPVEVWIETIGNSSNSHPIDVYISTVDAYITEHSCSSFGEDDANFQPLYLKEGLSVSELPFHFTWTPEFNDEYVLFFDNCDNNRESDYWLDTSQLGVKYAVDDQFDELGEGILAFLGGSLLLCCGGPLCLLIVIIVIVVKMNSNKQQQNVMAYQTPGVMPMQQQVVPAVQPAYQAPAVAPTVAPAPAPAPAPAAPPVQQVVPPPGGTAIPPLGGQQPPPGGQGGF